MRIFKSHPLLRLVNSYVIDSPQPSNLSYLWNFGSLLAFCLIIQIVTGVTLAMHYNPSVLEAFNSVEHIMRDVNNGWLIRYLHSNTASAFFFLVYLHIGRNLYYASYKAPRTLSFALGVVILVVMMATAFLGYVLPYGQMSLWGATVITNLMSAIPWIGQDIVEFIWGGFSVNNATLNRFFALHFVLPFVIAALVLMHLIALHDTVGSSNPLGISGNYDRLAFAPYFIFKDLVTIFLFILVLSVFVFFMPNVLGDSENYVMANPMQTPPAIVPEWYLLPFYAILRSIPNKLLGVIAMFAAILILLTLPFTDLSRTKGAQFKPLSKIIYYVFVANFLMLMVLGAKHVESPFIELGQISTVIYFLYFLLLVPQVTLFENTLIEMPSVKKSYSTHNISAPLAANAIWYKTPAFVIKFKKAHFRNPHNDPTINTIYRQDGSLKRDNWGNVRGFNHEYITPKGNVYNRFGRLIKDKFGNTYSKNGLVKDKFGFTWRDGVRYNSNNVQCNERGYEIREYNTDVLIHPTELTKRLESEYDSGSSSSSRSSTPDSNASSGSDTSNSSDESEDIKVYLYKEPDNFSLYDHSGKPVWDNGIPVHFVTYTRSFMDKRYNANGVRVNDNYVPIDKYGNPLEKRSSFMLDGIEYDYKGYSQPDHNGLKTHFNRIRTLDKDDNILVDDRGHNHYSWTRATWEQAGRKLRYDSPRPWGTYFQDSASPQMEGLIELHDNIMFYLVIILFAVGWIIISVIRNYSYKSSPISHKYSNHGTLIELVWTITPALILILIAFPSFKLLYLMDEVSDPAMAVLAEGHQWYWSYQYPDFLNTDQEFIEYDSYLVPESDLEEGTLRMLEVDNRVILPELTHVRFIVTAADVIHSYACPALGIKCDAYPGRLSQVSLLINREGVFYGQCSEICGILHSSMPIVIQSLSIEKFLSWLEEQ